ncbi:hypothetical protein HGM15179_013338 [Zosterops borbonicus]|uniref:RNA-directed DNA polymerase n=1 Tax=Zosterops borbonicus TaxID=364589 RepID=A0A8K1G994_9PASS|nr:hypothetical protein HGM15179_013338 [Zosterops borbonicus]
MTITRDRPEEVCKLRVGEETTTIKGLLDTGADVTVIPEHLWLSHWPLQTVVEQVEAAHQAIIYHYMDDVLVCAPNDDLLTHALDLTVTALVAAGFELQETKIQKMLPWKYLGLEIDGSGGSHKSVMTWKDPQTQQWESDIAEVEGSPQVAELAAVVRAFERFSEPFNLVTDSSYVAGVVSRAENSVLQEVSNIALFELLSKLIKLISHREQPFYVIHTRSHTDLPGFIAEGNRRADALAAPVAVPPLPDIYQQAKLSHQLFHQNVPGLVRGFKLTRDQAKAIVATCPSCQRHAVPTMHAGVNPQGLSSNEVWQMDVTHVSQFGKLKYVHVSVDTFSGAVYASAHTGERAGDVIKHLLQAFSFLGIPKAPEKIDRQVTNAALRRKKKPTGPVQEERFDVLSSIVVKSTLVTVVYLDIKLY